MIQRIQTIFLLLVIAVFITLFFVPVYTFSGSVTVIDAQVKGKILFIPILLVLLSCITILALVAIFSYQNRKRQMSMCRIGVIVSMLISLDAMVFPQFFIHGIDKSILQFGVGSYLLPINIILFALAANFIKRDENLVRAADRLR